MLARNTTARYSLLFSLLVLLVASYPNASFAHYIFRQWHEHLRSHFGEDKRPFLDEQGNSIIQSGCFRAQNETLQGMNVDRLVSIASVSKLFTSAWSLDHYGSDHRFETVLYVKDSVLHIQGSIDPVFGSAKMFWLMSELNKIGIYNIKDVTFDVNFVFFPIGISLHSYQTVFTDSDGVRHFKYFTPTLRETRSFLQRYLNTAAWNTEIRQDHIQKHNRHRSIIERNITLRVNSIRHSNKNPFVMNNGRIRRGVKVLRLKSSPLKNILKFSNSYSSNTPADLLFYGAGDSAGFNFFLRSKFDRSIARTVSFLSGSGLPYEKQLVETGEVLSREKNMATCRAVIKVLELLDDMQNRINPTTPMKLAADIMPVAGVEGTLRRLNFHRRWVGKTGSLKDTSSLSGTITTDLGKVHFAVLNQFSPHIQLINVGVDIMTIPTASRNFQQFLLEEIALANSGFKSFQYEKPPWMEFDQLFEGFGANTQNFKKSIDGDHGPTIEYLPFHFGEKIDPIFRVPYRS